MADDDIPFERDFDPKPDEVQQISPLIRRVLAPNPGPFTFTGTCTYIVGRGEVAIIDPGPDNAAHVAALVEATKDERVAHIVITHTHRDHAPASRALQQATGAAIVGCRPYAPRHANAKASGLDSAHDADYRPARILSEGDTLSFPYQPLENAFLYGMAHELKLSDLFGGEQQPVGRPMARRSDDQLHQRGVRAR